MGTFVYIRLGNIWKYCQATSWSISGIATLDLFSYLCTQPTASFFSFITFYGLTKTQLSHGIGASYKKFTYLEKINLLNSMKLLRAEYVSRLKNLILPSRLQSWDKFWIFFSCPFLKSWSLRQSIYKHQMKQKDCG